MAFTEAQVKSLEAKLDSKHVKTRQVQDTVLAYVEGWHVISEAIASSAMTLGIGRPSLLTVFGRAPPTPATQPPTWQRSVSL